MRICVFGSSSRDLDALYIDAAYELGRTLAEHGHGLVFGGYDVGLMGAVAHGVGDAGGSVRITVHTDKKAAFPIHLRIPEWANGAAVAVDVVAQPIKV